MDPSVPMKDKVSSNGVCRFLPYIGKEIPKKVEKDFPTLLAHYEMASREGISFYNSMKTQQKNTQI